VDISGSRKLASPLGFVVGVNSEASLNVIGTRKPAPVLTVSAPAGQTANMQEWKRGGNVTSSVSSMGTIVLKAGVDTIGGAPLKFRTGVNLSTPEDGGVEYDGTNYSVTVGTTRYVLAKTLTSSISLDFGSTANASASDVIIAFTGAVDGDIVNVGPLNAAVYAGSLYTAWVSSAGNITVRFFNNSGGLVDPPARNFRISILKY
jgi:hypothetical protein